jgi:hypothetical protein
MGAATHDTEWGLLSNQHTAKKRFLYDSSPKRHKEATAWNVGQSA